MIPYRELTSPKLKKEFSLRVPYTVQCAWLIFRAVPKHHELRDLLLRNRTSWKNWEDFTLWEINDVLDWTCALIAGQDSANPGFPQTLQNLRQYGYRSAIGHIYLEAVRLLSGRHAPPACFIRAKGASFRTKGRYEGTNIRKNLVLHEYASATKARPEEILMTIRFPRRGPVYVEKRSTFIHWFVESLLVLQRYESSRKLRRRADGAFQEPDSWKETGHGRRHGSEDQARFDAVLARL